MSLCSNKPTLITSPHEFHEEILTNMSTMYDTLLQDIEFIDYIEFFIICINLKQFADTL